MEHQGNTAPISKAIVIVATGNYNQYIHTLIPSALEKFADHVYLLTDKPEDYSEYENVTTIFTPHIGWPRMPLLRFELINKHYSHFKEDYIFLVDAEADFVRFIHDDDILGDTVATLHRNIMRLRKDYNYETRKESEAYVAPDEGEKYYACGFVGGKREEFGAICAWMTKTIRKDIANGIRAIWGDESYLNRYFIDNPPMRILPPSFMCPQGNPYFLPFIVHRNKNFKRVDVKEAKQFLTIDPKDYELDI